MCQMAWGSLRLHSPYANYSSTTYLTLNSLAPLSNNQWKNIGHISMKYSTYHILNKQKLETHQAPVNPF